MSTRTNPQPALSEEQQEALKVAVYLSGGAAKVAVAMGYRTGESVRRFVTGAKLVPAERVKDFRKATGNRLTLPQIRPDLYSKLRADALGTKRAKAGA